jgi:hypothetical protein
MREAKLIQQKEQSKERQIAKIDKRLPYLAITMHFLLDRVLGEKAAREANEDFMTIRHHGTNIDNIGRKYWRDIEVHWCFLSS